MKLKVIIECSDNKHFSACTDQVPGLVGFGDSIEAVKEDFKESIEIFAEAYETKRGEKPEWATAEIEFTYDIPAFFAVFPWVNASEVARRMGINKSLMLRYKSGNTRPSKQRLESIIDTARCMGKELASATF